MGTRKSENRWIAAELRQIAEHCRTVIARGQRWFLRRSRMNVVFAEELEEAADAKGHVVETLEQAFAAAAITSSR